MSDYDISGCNNDFVLLFLLQTDTFHIEAVNLGKLEKILIGHDGSGAGAGWKLEKVTVKENEEAKEKYVFLYGK